MGPSQEPVASGIWESILQEIATAAKTPDATLLMLGRAGVGKRTLVHALLAHSDPKAEKLEAERDSAPESDHSRAVGLDYAYFGVRDPDIAYDTTCPAACSVLLLEDVGQAKLLRSRLKPGGLGKCAAVVCLDLKEPWTMMDDLRAWFDVLQKVTAELLGELPLEEQDALRARVAASAGGDAGAEAAKSGAASLVINLGIPVVVVVTRADGASALENQKTIGWGEAIEVYIRNECLSYGAAIVYTMVQAKSSTNVDVLYEYLVHRLYGFSFKRVANQPSRDAVFVPSGWDSQEKIQKAAEGLQGGGLELSFESRIAPLDAPADAAPALEECEDMQTFLKRSTGILQRIGGATAAGARVTSAAGASGGPAAGAGAAAAQGSGAAGAAAGATGADALAPKRGSATSAGPAATDNSSLASFFQNLLTRGQDGRNSVTTAGGATGDSPAPGPAGACSVAGSVAGSPVPPAQASPAEGTQPEAGSAGGAAQTASGSEG